MELDHLFILTGEGAPGAAALQRLGVCEGSGNTHPGQGTACRRFFGVILRPTVDEVCLHTPEFPTWRHTPSYLPDGLAIDVADGTPLSEPEIFDLGFERIRARPGEEPLDQPFPRWGCAPRPSPARCPISCDRSCP